MTYLVICNVFFFSFLQLLFSKQDLQIIPQKNLQKIPNPSPQTKSKAIRRAASQRSKILDQSLPPKKNPDQSCFAHPFRRGCQFSAPSLHSHSNRPGLKSQAWWRFITHRWFVLWARAEKKWIENWSAIFRRDRKYWPETTPTIQKKLWERKSYENWVRKIWRSSYRQIAGNQNLIVLRWQQQLLPTSFFPVISASFPGPGYAKYVAFSG